MDIFAPVALLAAIAAALGAGFLLWSGQSANRAGRGALFTTERQVAYERAKRYESTYLYFPGVDVREQSAVVGPDPYPLGLGAMGKNIERAIRGSLEQGLLTKPLRLEDLYYRTTLNT